MGREDDPMAVTDASGRVLGVYGLRICDASLMPAVPCANTNISTIMIAEKIADHVKAGEAAKPSGTHTRPISEPADRPLDRQQERISVIANLSLLLRRPDIENGQFRKRWLDPHGTLAAGLPRLRRYMQHHVLESISPGGGAEFIDGVASLWFASREDLAAAYRSPILAACNTDSEAFIGAVSRILAIPHIIRERTDVDLSDPFGALFILCGAGGGDADWLEKTSTLLRNSNGVVEATAYEVQSQAPAPESRIGDLGVAVAGFIEAKFVDRSAAVSRSLEVKAISPRQCELVALGIHTLSLV
jgi:uncharacterized protein (TIGR02118 family)